VLSLRVPTLLSSDYPAPPATYSLSLHDALPISRYIKVTLDGDIYFDADFRFKPDDTFTVTVEEIVAPTTRFDELTEYIYDSNDDHHFTAEHKGANISMIIDCETHQFKTQAIYCKDTLVWTKEHGIPESGRLAVEG